MIRAIPIKNKNLINVWLELLYHAGEQQKDILPLNAIQLSELDFVSLNFDEF